MQGSDSVSVVGADSWQFPDGPNSFCAAIDTDASDKYSVSGGSVEVAIEFLHNLHPRLDKWVGEGLPAMALDKGESCAVFTDSPFGNDFPPYVLQKEIPALLPWEQSWLPLVCESVKGLFFQSPWWLRGGGGLGSLTGDGGGVGTPCPSGELSEELMILAFEALLRAATFLLAGGILYKP
ncbi:OLC1v1030499C1 [Oldenlandia corymbosa var. corymbosa]|uniref:OLC1v1030499C1 n=1 Tax=Oldenlandia corymbosa var. corymbosa TaxID=529605 RepID=A0AAV1CJT5_OLDCO|nr:OLC1v1030499C1 [Oldenlandia corymbosa var. corymbosa]